MAAGMVAGNLVDQHKQLVAVVVHKLVVVAAALLVVADVVQPVVVVVVAAKQLVVVGQVQEVFACFVAGQVVALVSFAVVAVLLVVPELEGGSIFVQLQLLWLVAVRVWRSAAC